MPKKTKKEKLLAQIHRSRAHVDIGSLRTDRPVAPESSHYVLSLPSLKTGANKPAPAFVTESNPHLKRDLVKTVIITIAIIVSEIVLSRTLL